MHEEQRSSASGDAESATATSAEQPVANPEEQQQQPSSSNDAAPSPPPPSPSKTTPAQRGRLQMEHFNRIREHVKKAIASRHIFMIHGRSRIVREALLARNWCEKLPRKSSPGTNVTMPANRPSLLMQQIARSTVGEQQLSVDSSPSTLLAGVGDLGEPQNERLLISKMLSGHTPDLLWNSGSEWNGWPAQDNKSTIFNRFARANFTSKIGLCCNVRQMHWYYEAGIANTLFPRCYNISQPDQMAAFVEDFRMTACLSLLKWLVERAAGGPGAEEALRSNSGLVPLRALDFAIGRCSDLIGSKSHEDIDHEPEKVWSHQWEQFIGWYYKLVHGQATFVGGGNNGSAGAVPLHKYVMAARHLLRKVRPFWPQLDMDGSLNVWILKPGNKSRGRGIVLMNRLDDILAKLSPSNKANDTRFVVQKYIERPLLIYDTKFDIRQWFLVTSAQPLTVWMYRESYLRFCSQKFSLRDFHESIHLSNNAVQCKYKNSPERESALPADNMWDVATFKQFLAKRGDPDAWERLIYPGIKQGLVGSLLASQEAMDRRKNSFELYGADFMLMDDYSVWLIEINSHPDMSNSTSVTSRLCRKAMEDIIKVVVDYRENPTTADTGDFELVYRQKLSHGQAYLGTGLSLHGTRIPAAPSSSRGRKLPAATQVSSSSPALVDLIEELELQLDHEFYEYVKLRQTGALGRQGLPLVDSAYYGEKQIEQQQQQHQLADAQTNTANNRTVDLAFSQSQINTLDASNASSIDQQLRDSSRSPRTTSNSMRLQRSGKVSQQQQRTNLISKIIDLQRHVGNPRSALPFKRPLKPPTRATQLQSGRSSATNNQLAKIETKSATTSKEKPSEKGNRVKDKPGIHSKKRGRLSSGKLSTDVKDMYAVGLGVSK